MTTPILIAPNHTINNALNASHSVMWFSLGQMSASAFPKCSALHLFIPLIAKKDTMHNMTWFGWNIYLSI